jgi:hypothetical protein
VALSNIRFVQLVSKDSTAVQTAKDRTGKTDTIKNARNFKRK